MTMTSVNNGEPYYLKVDISKAGESTVSINDYIKMRVFDNGKVLPVKWFDQNVVMNVNGMIPFIEGSVGQFSTDDNDNIVMSPDAVHRDWQGTAANTRDGGWADYILTDQMFTEEGAFSGFIGLMDGNGRRLTSINIWFRVLGDNLVFGLTQKYYSDKIEKFLRNAQVKVDQTIQDARETYTKETQATRDALMAKEAEVEATRAEQRIINGQIDNIQDQIDKNQIVRKSEFVTNSEALTASINGKLAQINTNPEAFDTLDELKTKYPEGKSGLFFVGKTKHLYIYDQSNWKDIGEFPTAGLTDQQNQILSNAIYNQIFIYSDDQLKAPYTDLDLYPANTIVNVGVNTSGILHKPAELSSEGFTIMTYGNSDTPHGTIKDTIVQILTAQNGKMFWRIHWFGSFTKWNSSNNQGLVDNAIYNQTFIYSDDQLKAPYTDLDLYPANTIVSVGVNTSGILHKPAELSSEGFTIMTYGPSVAPHGEVKDGAVQFLTIDDGRQFWRIHWSGSFTKWNSNNSKFFYSQNQINAPYDDLNTFPQNDCAVYATDITKIKNAPASSGSITIKTWGIYNNDAQSGTVQLVANKDNLYYRTSWGGKINFSPWKKIRGNNSENAELEYAKPSLSMFGKFGVIGDSYASGVLEDFEHKQKDIFAQMTPEMTENLSWPTMLARKWGTSMLHLAKGGLSTRTWLTDDQGLKKLNESDPQDIYYLCLGINDYYGLGDSYLGIESDMESGADSFYGNYGKIIKAIKAKAPLAKIIMFGIAITPGDGHDRQQRFSDAQQKIAEHFNIPFISENDDELFSSDYYTKSMGSGHPSSYLYGAMSEAFERLIQRAIYRNRDYFYSYGWNGEL